MNRHHTQPAPTVVDLAEHATQTVRDLNHLTRFHDAITEPADLSRLLAELAAITSGLPQLLRQLHRWLSHEHDTQQLGADTHTDPGEYVNAAAAELTHAGQAARHLTATLDTAHEHLAHLATATTDRHKTEQTNQGVSFHP
jgi:hypothetical protein